jgi:hypothetical protein
VVGVVGQRVTVRVVGVSVSVAAGAAFAVAAALAGELPLRGAGFAVLAVAALALAAGGVLAGRRVVESRALDVSAHATAVLALVLAADGLRYAAAVCTLWGLSTGVRALWRPERRRVLISVTVGGELLAWWLTLAADRVVVTEAYTLPAAGVALVVGWFALRAVPTRSSWLAYGPGLAAAFLPSLGSVLVADGQVWRRLSLGLAAVAVVSAGAVARRQAPVVIGGVAVAVVALRELAAVWDLLPRWIFLAVGGLGLIALAMTYERRRRDLRRLRSSVSGMG